MVISLWNQYVASTSLVLSAQDIVSASGTKGNVVDIQRKLNGDGLHADDKWVLMTVPLARTKSPDLSLTASPLLSILIDSIGRNGPLGILKLLARKLRQPNPLFPQLEINHYNSFIEAYARNGMFDDAWETFLTAENDGRASKRWKEVELKTVRSLLTFLHNAGDTVRLEMANRYLSQRSPHLAASIRGKTLVI
jgi:pentatricopeptide repeat protein